MFRKLCRIVIDCAATWSIFLKVFSHQQSFFLFSIYKLNKFPNIHIRVFLQQSVASSTTNFKNFRCLCSSILFLILNFICFDSNCNDVSYIANEILFKKKLSKI